MLDLLILSNMSTSDNNVTGVFSIVEVFIILCCCLKRFPMNLHLALTLTTYIRTHITVLSSVPINTRFSATSFRSAATTVDTAIQFAYVPYFLSASPTSSQSSSSITEIAKHILATTQQHYPKNQHLRAMYVYIYYCM